MASTILAAAIGLASFVLPTRASSIAAFYTAPLPGAQVIYQNATTGDITHSLCTSYGQPVFPRDPPRSFQLPYTAMNGTSLAATGWYADTVYATIFYQSINNDIVVAIYKCDGTVGDYTSVSNFIISSVKGTPTLHKNTGLAINLLGASNGEHLYFHDNNKSVHGFHYTNDAGWTYASLVSPDHNLGSMALATAFIGSNETIFTPKDSANAEMSVFNTDNTWHISTFPKELADSEYNSSSTSTNPSVSSGKADSNLTAWDGKTNALGASIDKDNTKYMFYIGTDKKLHLATSALNSGEFQPFIMQADVGPDLWPVADESNGDLAVAYNPASYDVSLFYFANESIVAVNQTGRLGGWQTAYALPLTNATSTNGTTPSGGSSGLTTGQQAGIGVGVGIAGLLVIGALIIFFLRQRRRKLEAQRQSAAPSEMVMGPDGHMIPAGHLSMNGQPPYDYSQVQQQYDYRQYDYGSQEATPQWGPDKKALSPGPPIGVEMPDSSPAHHRMSELPSDFHESHELPGADVDRIQAASPEPHAAYTTPMDQQGVQQDYSAVSSGLNSTTPGSPDQRAVSTSSWTASSPPPNYISQAGSPAPSTAYTQSYYPATQPLSPQMTGSSAEHQYQQPQNYSPEGGYAQQAQPQHESLGAITEQHEGVHPQYQGQYQDQSQHYQQQQQYDPQQQQQQQYVQPQQHHYEQQPQQHHQ